MTETTDSEAWHSDWKVWTETKNEAKARRVLAWVEDALAREVLDVTVEPYHKGGHVVRFRLDHDFSDWPSFVLEVIALGQCVGYGWSLYGDIRTQSSGWSNESSISGVKAMQWMIDSP